MKTKRIPTFDELLATAPEGLKDYIAKCFNTPQGTNWHPEGNVGIHIKLVYDRAAKFEDINLALAAFFHDLGKVDTTQKNKRGGWSAHGHENVSAKLVGKYSDWVKTSGGDPIEVRELVYQHMRIKQIDDMKITKREIMKKHPLYNKLLEFTTCDNMQTLTNEELNRYK